MAQTLNAEVLPFIVVEVLGVVIVVRNWDEGGLQGMLVEAVPVKVLKPWMELYFNRPVLAKSLDGFALY